MRPTITDETLACLAELNADIEVMSEVLSYIMPIQEQLNTLIEKMQKEETAWKALTNYAAK